LVEIEEGLYQDYLLQSLMLRTTEPGSIPWMRYTEYISQRQQITLSHAAIAFLSENSPVPNENPKYVPIPGYDGILAPGLTFKSTDSVEEEARFHKVGFPFYQEFPPVVEWPVVRPPIPDPLTWAAMNDLLIYVSRRYSLILN
jgi:hypothetical protein